jgi:hypothetical protein
MQNSNKLIIFSALAAIIASLGDILATYLFGLMIPGYNQLTETMSSLGISTSPVSNQVSAWWIIMGFLFIFFGFGFKKAYQEKGKYAIWAAWIIILYGLGEGIGSGAFKADHINNQPTIFALIHDTLGGIGVFATLSLPLIMQKIYSMPWFSKLSKIVFVTGILFILMFLFRYSFNTDNFLSTYKGLWQRLYMLNTYIYMVTLAILTIIKQKKLAQ